MLQVSKFCTLHKDLTSFCNNLRKIILQYKTPVQHKHQTIWVDDLGLLHSGCARLVEWTHAHFGLLYVFCFIVFNPEPGVEYKVTSSLRKLIYSQVLSYILTIILQIFVRSKVDKPNFLESLLFYTLGPRGTGERIIRV